MTESLRVLLARVIDYAGMFPPARLPLEEAARAYAQLRADAESWMLARFVCPVVRLEELAPLAAGLLSGGPPCPVAALGRGGDGRADLLAALGDDLADIGRFNAQRCGAVVDQLEVRLPGRVLDTGADGVARLVSAAGHLVDERAATRLLVAFEVAAAGAPPERFATAVEGIAGGGATRGPGSRWLPCLKIRCGGLDATAVPTAGEVATALVGCRDRKLLLKATQGLHHPFPRLDPVLGVPVHGFLNLLVACLLARAHGLDHSGVRTILEDTDPAHFAFDDEEVSWQDSSATMAQVAESRRFGVASFGSCSFDEPREELRALGLLPGTPGERPEVMQ
ncbi:MAG: hypothetical protein ACM3O7_03625 [Acidobacteriota bacterium]